MVMLKIHNPSASLHIGSIVVLQNTATATLESTSSPTSSSSATSTRFISAHCTIIGSGNPQFGVNATLVEVPPLHWHRDVDIPPLSHSTIQFLKTVQQILVPNDATAINIANKQYWDDAINANNSEYWRHILSDLSNCRFYNSKHVVCAVMNAML
eukprot:124279_1